MILYCVRLTATLLVLFPSTCFSVAMSSNLEVILRDPTITTEILSYLKGFELVRFALTTKRNEELMKLYTSRLDCYGRPNFNKFPGVTYLALEDDEKLTSLPPSLTNYLLCTLQNQSVRFLKLSNF